MLFLYRGLKGGFRGGGGVYLKKKKTFTWYDLGIQRERTHYTTNLDTELSYILAILECQAIKIHPRWLVELAICTIKWTSSDLDAIVWYAFGRWGCCWMALYSIKEILNCIIGSTTWYQFYKYVWYFNVYSIGLELKLETIFLFSVFWMCVCLYKDLGWSFEEVS